MSFDKSLEPALDARRQAKRFRERKVLQTAQSTQVSVDGRSCLNFCSNDYLGLANHPDVVAAFKDAADVYGVGSGASHLVCGHSSEHHALEEELAAFCGRDRAILFSTGYMANLGVINALCGKGDSVFEDKLNHASLLDGGMSSNAVFYRYKHSDLQHLESRLKQKKQGRALIVTDGVFSMDGDGAKLTELAELATRQNAVLMVDDAHGFGVLGEHGGGLCEEAGLTQREVPILVGTLGKAFGTFGAFVAGSEQLINTLVQFARPYIYTTALPPAVAAATRTSLEILQSESWRRQRLSALIAQFRSGCKNAGLDLMPSPSAIQPIVIGDDEKALKLSEALMQRGFWVSAIRPPTVPEGTARLRFTLTAEHEPEQVDLLVNALVESMGVLEAS